MGPVAQLNLLYDRAGRSEGVAYVTYMHNEDARAAIKEFDGANAKGQPIRLTMVALGREGNPLIDRVERPQASLFDRVKYPHRDMYSFSDGSDDDDDDDGGRRRRNPDLPRKSNVSNPASGLIDRYVPGRRSPVQTHGWGSRGWNSERPRTEYRRPVDHRRQGVRRPRERFGGVRRPRASDGALMVNGRPRKTQEELDQEMDNYWNSTKSGVNGDEAPGVIVDPATATPAEAPGPDTDVAMVE